MRAVSAKRAQSVQTVPVSRAVHVPVRVRRGALALGLAWALAALPASALPGDETLLLDLCINDRCVGVAAVIARGDDVLVDREALATAGIDTTDTVPEHLGERDFV